MDDDVPVAERLGERLRATDGTLSTAESCTGGLVASLVTDVPGSSDYFDRADVTYSYDAKLALGVPRELLDEHGAVSEPVATAMARGIRDRAGTTWAVATTGIAGPTGGTPEKPVGTVFIAVAYAGEWGSGESYAVCERQRFDGGRVGIKKAIARAALEMVVREIDARDDQ